MGVNSVYGVAMLKLTGILAACGLVSRLRRPLGLDRRPDSDRDLDCSLDRARGVLEFVQSRQLTSDERAHVVKQKHQWASGLAQMPTAAGHHAWTITQSLNSGLAR